MERDGRPLDLDAAAPPPRRLCRGRLRQLRHGRPLRQRRGSSPAAAWRRSARARRGTPPAPSPNGARRPAPMTRGVVRAGVAAQPRPPRRRRASTCCSSTGGPSSIRPISTRMRELAALQRRGADRPSRRHQLRHRPSARAGEARHPDRHQPGLLLAARPPRRRGDERVLPRQRREAAGLRHARRRLPLRPLAGRARAGGARHRRLEQDEVQALHRCRSAAGPCCRPSWRRSPRSRASTASRRQRRDALGAGAAGGRRHHRRRAPRRARAPRRQPARLLLRARRRRTARRSTRALAATTPHSRRLRRRIPPAALPHRLGRSQPPSERACRSSTRRRRCPAAPSGCASIPAACGSRSPATAARSASATASWSAARRPRTAPARSSARAIVAGQTVYILDKIAASIAALGGTLDDVVRTRIYLRDAAQWEPACRASTAAISAQIRPANTLIEVVGPGRRLRGRDRGRGRVGP